ncbi:MAG: NADH-quinone oxidoreductase subunit L, partial [Gammaproteobacteria bacterium]|nr:NADH-quinone oxidoreductase subunit L [Gammaproteobacteria bacterium]
MSAFLPMLLVAIVLAPLTAAIIVGCGMRFIPRRAAHVLTILAVALSTALSAWVLWQMVFAGMGSYDINLYDWGSIGNIQFNIGFMIDRLSVLMMTVVSFVSLMVHIYTIGYMAEDPGYKRFFSYISLFTFSMLILVMANNFLLLFIGWELVGLVSYLLIG